MLVYYFIYGLLVFVVVKLLNGTAFKQKPASRLTAWSLAILMFIITVFALSALRWLSYERVSLQQLSIIPAFLFGWMFFSILNREEKWRNNGNTGSVPY